MHEKQRGGDDDLVFPIWPSATYVYVPKGKLFAFRHKSFLTPLASSTGCFLFFFHFGDDDKNTQEGSVALSPQTLITQSEREKERERESSWKDQFVCTGNCVMLITTLIWAELAF